MTCYANACEWLKLVVLCVENTRQNAIVSKWKKARGKGLPIYTAGYSRFAFTVQG